MGLTRDQREFVHEASRELRDPLTICRGHLELLSEWIDLALFTHELVAKAGALDSRDWRLDHAADGRVHADRHHLTEAVMNLAHNAVQHTLEHETIAIGTSLSEEEVRIWVRDTGSEIPLSDQERVFDRFTRGRDAHRRYRGGGLGLAIVRSIAEAHGGRVELESRLAEGSTFTIVLPRHPPARAPSGAAGEASRVLLPGPRARGRRARPA